MIYISYKISGADHRSLDALEQFATNEAIQITEIFEYVQKLSDPNATPILHSFLYYKFLYAIRLLDFGFCDSALHYLEELAQVKILKIWKFEIILFP